MGTAQLVADRGLRRRRAEATSPQDQRAERLLGALSCVVLVLIAGMVGFVLVKAWPSFAHNGLGWFATDPGVVDDQISDIYNNNEYAIGAWPLLYSTALITVASLAIATVFSLLCAMFIVEFAPPAVKRVLEPAVRLLAAVPSVIYGLIGILVIVPFVRDHLISEERQASVAYVIQLTGEGLIVAILILTIMITPIMIAIIVDALRGVPTVWREGAYALGVNRWRALWTVSVRAARPAIVAAAVLAMARALGEAVMLSMVSGGLSFAPNPLDGLTFFFEPTRPLAAAIIDFREGQTVPALGATLYAFAAVLLVSAAFFSFAGWYARRSLRRYLLTAQ